MFPHSQIPSDARWVYDDPSGVPDGPLTVDVPAPLRRSVELAAARDGMSPAIWLLETVRRGLRPATVRAL